MERGKPYGSVDLRTVPFGVLRAACTQGFNGCCSPHEASFFKALFQDQDVLPFRCRFCFLRGSSTPSRETTCKGHLRGSRDVWEKWCDSALRVCNYNLKIRGDLVSRRFIFYGFDDCTLVGAETYRI